MTEDFVQAVARAASPLVRLGAHLRAGLARWPWLRLAVAPVILLVAAGLALMALLAGRHGLAMLTLFVALPLATLCLILCRDPDED